MKLKKYWPVLALIAIVAAFVFLSRSGGGGGGGSQYIDGAERDPGNSYFGGYPQAPTAPQTGYIPPANTTPNKTQPTQVPIKNIGGRWDNNKKYIQDPNWKPPQNSLERHYIDPETKQVVIVY